MKTKKNGKKAKKVILTLSERDFAKLSGYAQMQHVSRPLAAKRLLHEQLAAIAIDKSQRNAENQLGLFDSLQINIFNETSRTSD